MKFNKILPCLLFPLLSGVSFGQVGINTGFPNADLEMRGAGTQFLRVQSTTTNTAEAGLELVRGNPAYSARDWKITNYPSGLRFATATDNFNTASYTKLLLTSAGNLGIGTVDPETRVHIVGGVSGTNTGDGYLTIGPKSGSNLVFDDNGIIARNNGASSTLFIQAAGGNTIFGSGTGTTHILVPNGNVVVGGGINNALLNIRADDQFQVNLRNVGAGANNWYIGASNQNWAAGDNQLVFTPTSSSDDAPLRLNDVDDNDGTTAPVILKTSAGQTMLLDGNEIDGQSNPLYINHNSDNDTYINPSGGKVGIGLTSPHGLVHVNTSNYALALQNQGLIWKLAPTPSGDIMFSNNANGVVALVSWNGGGSWVALSDSTRKHKVLPLENAMAKIDAIQLHAYNFKCDPYGQEDIGVLAQELKNVVPEAVFQNEGQYGVTYDQLTALAVRGIQEQQAEIEDLLELCASIRKSRAQ